MSHRRALPGALLALLLAALFVPAAQAQTVGLGTADSFAVLGGSTVTNTGPSVISGDLGVSPGAAVTGFPPGTVINGSIHAADAVALQAQTDLTTAYNDAAGRGPGASAAGDLGGRTLVPGVYTSATSIGLTGDLTLDAQGNADAVFIFQAGSTLTTASASRVVLIGGAQACNVFWQVGSSATLGTNSIFAGNVLALTSISATTGTTVSGRLLARNGAVTLDTNTVTRAVCAVPAGGGTVTPPGGGTVTPPGGGTVTPPGGTVTPPDGEDTPTGAGGPGTPTGPPRFVRPPTRCVAEPFYARITGADIAQVTFRLDGRIIRRVRAKLGRTMFVVLIRPARQTFEPHRIVARVRFTAASGKAPRTLRLAYRRCGTVAAAPQFTG